MSKPHSVLFVDDDKRIQRSWRRALHDEPYNLLFAQSGQDALYLMKGLRASVVVTDYAMPNGDGLFLLRELRDRMPWVRSILVSGHATLTVAQEAINDLGIVKLFQKPCSSIELALAIRQELLALDGDPSVSPSKREELRQLEKNYPGITQVERDERGVIILNGGRLEASDANTE